MFNIHLHLCKGKIMFFFFNVNNVIFTWEKGFHNVFGDRPTKWLIAKKKNDKNMHPQLINVKKLMNCIEFVIQIDECSKIFKLQQ
jgi:hypothetical protein